MTTSIRYSRTEDLIRVCESGVIGPTEFTESVRKIRDIIDREGCLRVLVDASSQLSRTEGLDAYDRATLAARELAGTGIRLAVVVTPMLHDGHGFFETVSRNRGLLLQVFLDEAAALEWLRP